MNGSINITIVYPLKCKCGSTNVTVDLLNYCLKCFTCGYETHEAISENGAKLIVEPPISKDGDKR